MKREFTKQEIFRICILCFLVALFAFCIVFICVINYKIRQEEKRWETVDCYVQVTDLATGISYNVGDRDDDAIIIPYDGLEHTFSYTVLRVKGNKPVGKTGLLEKEILDGNVARLPGRYWYDVLIYHSEAIHQSVLVCLIIQEPEKLQPTINFDLNGAIEHLYECVYKYERYEYFKFEYTGEVRCPIVYAEYKEERLYPFDKADIVRCTDSTDQLIDAPRNIGKYLVTIRIDCYKEDPERVKYAPVEKTIVIEIVE